MLTIGFAGTAKNTGKTTAALSVLDQAATAGLRMALTSIGYDGESIDNITGLPKPRYFQRPGMLLATAQTCLQAGSASVRILDITSIGTILGPVVLAEITAPGSVVLAGPNRGVDLHQLYRRLAALGADLTIVDGALNRLAPMEGAGGLVLSTGAAFDEDIPTIATHAAALTSLFAYPASLSYPAARVIQVKIAGEEARALHTGSLLSRQTLAALAALLERPAAMLSIPGACDPALFLDLATTHSHHLENAVITFGSPLKLAASGNPLVWIQAFSALRDRGATITYRRTLSLRLVTVNPFYPRYLSSGRYETAYVDKDALLSAVQSSVTACPVFNIQAAPPPDLLALLGLTTKEKPYA